MANTKGMHDPNSAEYAHWRERTLAAFGVQFLDVPARKVQTGSRAD